MSLDEEDIFMHMYNFARDLDCIKSKCYLEECKNRFLERIIEDPHILKSRMEEFFTDKRRLVPPVRKYYKLSPLMDLDKKIIADLAKPLVNIDYWRHYLLV